MQAPERERSVAHPAVAVVPVAFAARRLRQRGRRRRDERAGGHEREPLEHQRRALQVLAPRVIGIVPFGQPAAPELTRSLDAFSRLLHVARPAQRLRPRHRAVALLALAHRVPSMHAVALDAQADVAVQAHDPLAVGDVLREPAFGPELDRLPLRGRRTVVEHRLAHELDLHLPLDAFHQAHDQMIGVEVRGRARVRRALLVVVPRADRERVDHPQPALRRHPRRLDDVRPRHVAPPRGHEHAVRAHAPAARATIEHRSEDRRRVEVRQAHPLDRTVGGNERAGVAVGEEAVVGDCRKRRARPGRAAEASDQRLWRKAEAHRLTR